MKKNVFSNMFMVASVVTILNFSSCASDDDEASYSIGSDSASSLIGEWEVIRVDGMMMAEDGYYSWEVEFEKEGDFQTHMAYHTLGDTTWYDYSGKWEWSGNAEDFIKVYEMTEGDGGMSEGDEPLEFKLIDDDGLIMNMGGKEFEFVKKN